MNCGDLGFVGFPEQRHGQARGDRRQNGILAGRDRSGGPQCVRLNAARRSRSAGRRARRPTPSARSASAPSTASKPERRISDSGCSLTLASTSADVARACSVRCSCCSASSPEVSIEISRCISSTTARVCRPAAAPAAPRSCPPRRRTASRTARTPARPRGSASPAAVRLHAEQRAHAVDEEHAGQHQPDLHRHRQVEDHGQHEGAEQDRAVLQAELAQPHELVPLAHVPGHEQQDAGQRRQRHVQRPAAPPPAPPPAASARARCRPPATVAPARTLVTVRAIVPVAGMPPKNGVTKLATPCAISSWFGSWRGWSVRLSAMRAHISDSIAPSSAMVTVGISSCLADVPAERRQARSAAALAGCRRSASRWSPPAGRAAPPAAVSDTSATTGPGTRAAVRSVRPSSSAGRQHVRRRNSRGHSEQAARRQPAPMRQRVRVEAVEVRAQHAAICAKKSAGILVDRQARAGRAAATARSAPRCRW